MLRSILNLLLVFAALLLDLGLPVWTGGSFTPSCLDLALVIVLSGTSSAAGVFWAGLIGAGYEFVHVTPVGVGIMGAATVALVATWWRGTNVPRRTAIDRVFSCLILLATLESLRVLLAAVVGPAGFHLDLLQFMPRLALTILTAAGVCLGTACLHTRGNWNTDQR